MDPTELSCLAIQIRTSHENWSRREFERIARALDRAANRIWELQREVNKQGDLLESANVHTDLTQDADRGSTDR